MHRFVLSLVIVVAWVGTGWAQSPAAQQVGAQIA